MAQVYVSTDGNLVIPQATVSIAVQTANSGLAASGIVILVGEADAGPDFTQESDLNNNAFGPDQLAFVAAKYKSGNLVDAFRIAANPLSDPNIVGAPSRIIPIKTNVGLKASGTLPKIGGGTYATLYDQSFGALGNNISYQTVSSIAEVVPTTGSFTWIPSAGTVNLDLRVNGGAVIAVALSANETPTAAVSALTGAGVTASGGAARTTIQASTGTLALAVVSGNNVTISYSGTFTTTPTAGDTVVIPNGSVITGGAHQNTGAYVVTAASNNSITATKLSDAGAGAPVPGTITAPVNVSASAVSGTVANDLIDYSPVTIALTAANVIDGVAKSLEIADVATGTDLFSRIAKQLGTVTTVTWISLSGAGQLLTSAAEYAVELDDARQVDAISESLVAGGEIGMKICYTGTTAVMTITPTLLTTTVVGGSGSNLSLSLKNFPTIADLAAYINAQTGYKALVGNASAGQLPSTALDDVTAQGICSQFGAYNGRTKTDAYRFFNKLSGSVLVQLGNPSAQAGAGIPDVMATTSFLGGGARGGTTDAQILAALTALTKVRGNFVVPLFSRNASSDITDGLTDSTSTYTIAAVHANLRSHVLAMSKVKARKNRQGFASIRDTFTNAKAAAQNMATPVVSMSFLDQKVVGGDGSIQQFQPWMDAVIAAGGQAAGFYKAIVRKFKNISGSLQAAGDWSDLDDSAVEDALLAGLLPTRRHPNGGWYFVSDQTTYSKDSNFVYNSIQAMYASFTIALTAAQRMEDAFVGQSVADVSAAVALAFLEAIFADFLRLKLMAPSDDAPLGFKNASIVISGPAMIVSAEIKLAGAIYFIPIKFSISQVQQTAAQ